MTLLKDPDATLDYSWDWNRVLSYYDDDTIASHTVEASDGITVEASDEDAGIVTAWLSGGTLHSKYQVTCRIVTAGGRTDEWSIAIRIRDR